MYQLDLETRPFRWPGQPASGQARGLGEWARVVTTGRSSSTSSRTSRSTRTLLTAIDVLEYGAEIVVIATGSRFATDGLNPVTHDTIRGADATPDWQLTPDEVVLSTSPSGNGS